MEKIRKYIPILTIIIIAIVAIGATSIFTDRASIYNTGEDYSLEIAVTIPSQAEHVEEIGGRKVNTITMVPEGENPHNYSPSEEKLEKLTEVDIYYKVGSGIDFEEKHMDTIKEQNSDMEIVSGKENISLREIENQTKVDTHIWLSTQNTGKMIKTLLKTMEKIDTTHLFTVEKRAQTQIESLNEENLPEQLENKYEEENHTISENFELSKEKENEKWILRNKGPDYIHEIRKENGKLKIYDATNAHYYESNAEKYLEKLENLHQEIKENLSEFEGRSFLTYHPSLGYFADDYDLNQIPIKAGGQNPGASDLEAIIERAEKENIKTVFVSPQFSKNDAKIIADSIDGEVTEFNPLAKNHLKNLESIYETLLESFR